MFTFARVSAPNAILEHGRAEEALFAYGRGQEMQRRAWAQPKAFI